MYFLVWFNDGSLNMVCVWLKKKKKNVLNVLRFLNVQVTTATLCSTAFVMSIICQAVRSNPQQYCCNEKYHWYHWVTLYGNGFLYYRCIKWSVILSNGIASEIIIIHAVMNYYDRTSYYTYFLFANKISGQRTKTLSKTNRYAACAIKL